MIHIDIYLENTEKYVKKKQGWYGYVLTYQGREFHIADGYRKVEDTRNGRDARMFLEALGRCKPNPYDITIHTDSTYLQGTHAYTERIRAEIERRKKDDKQGTERISGTIQG